MTLEAYIEHSPSGGWLVFYKDRLVASTITKWGAMRIARRLLRYGQQRITVTVTR